MLNAVIDVALLCVAVAASLMARALATTAKVLFDFANWLRGKR